LLSLKGSAPVHAIQDTDSYSAYANGGKMYFQGLDSDGAVKTFSGIKGVSQSSNNGQLRLQTRTGGSLYDRLTLTAAGNCAIGATSSNSRLHVKGIDTTIGVHTYPQLTLETDSTDGAANKGTGIMFLNHDGNGGKFGGGIRVLNENATVLNHASYMSFTTRPNSGSVTERLRILSTGGITFNGDTATANALNGYEEGSYTPTFNNLGTPSDITVSHFTYTKIGRLVHVEFQFDVSASINDSSGFQFTLPFGTFGNRNINIPCISNISSGAVPFSFVHNTNGTQLLAKESTDDYSTLTYNHFSGKVLIGGGTYETDG